MTNKELDLDHDSMVMGKEAECMSLSAGGGGGWLWSGEAQEVTAESMFSRGIGSKIEEVLEI